MDRLAHSVLAYIRKAELLQPGDRVGVAVSGGADSVALLRLLLALRDELGLILSVAHLNHQLRGAESDGDEQFVRELADSHGVEFQAEHRDVGQHATQNKVGIEAAARHLRYEFFARLLGSGVRSKVATAHTLDDQAETVLLKLARGAGTRGLAGIWPKVAGGRQPSALNQEKPTTDDRRPTTGDIVRPLLATRRTELRKYLASIGQTWREDSSNRDLRHTRNRIRHGILPRIERHVNPNIRETLAETAEIARAEEQYWADEVARWLEQVWEVESLDRAKLESLPLALQRRLVRAVAEFQGLNLEFRHVEEILALGPHAAASLPNGQTASRCGDLIMFGEAASPATNYAHLLSVPGSVEIPELGVTLETTLVSGGHVDSLLDLRLAQHELVLRNWRAGERFWPAHTKEPRKIKELLQDRNVTGDEKRTWPVIADGGEIVWMRGLGVRRDFRAKDGQGILIRERESRRRP